MLDIYRKEASDVINKIDYEAQAHHEVSELWTSDARQTQTHWPRMPMHPVPGTRFRHARRRRTSNQPFRK